MKTIFVSLMSLLMLVPSFTPVAAQSVTPSHLIKGSGEAVYWYGNDMRRYVFPNPRTFYSWFSPYDFSLVARIPDAELAAIPIAGTMTYRPGSRLIKITTDPRVYAVDRYGVLRWIESETVAQALYGQNWARFIDDIPDAFFVIYSVGPSITRASDYTLATILTPNDNIPPGR